MSMNINTQALRDFIELKVGSALDKNEANALGISETSFNDALEDKDESIPVDAIIDDDKGDIYAQFAKLYEEENKGDAKDEEDGLKAPEGSSNGGKA